MPPSATTPPAVWLLLADKLGDNAQARLLTDATGLAYAQKTVLPRPEWVLGKPRFRPTLDHLDPERSDRLEPPWPDLIVTVGRRPTMAALWVKEQSGWRTRLVVVGRPRRRLLDYDLVVAPPQYQVPDGPNVVHLDLPLMRADPGAVAAAAGRWRERLDRLPRPLTAVLIGGETQPYRLDAEVARGLLRELATIRQRDGGSLYLTTSRRTSAAVVEALAAGLPASATLHRWRPDDPDNPYLGLLGLADRFVVSGDSVSMMVEVARLGRPLAIFPLPTRRDARTLAHQAIGRGLQGDGPLGALGRAGRALRLAAYGRDLALLHERLVERGLAVRLGAPFKDPTGEAGDDLASAAARVRALAPPVATG
jgi:mitochondrial fission protein ELM1